MTPKDEMLLLLKMKSLNLTPNEYFYLRLLERDQLSFLSYDIKETEDSLVKKLGSIKQAKSLLSVEGDELSELVDNYRQLWPKGKLPSGALAKSTNMEVSAKMKWFLTNFPEHKNKILDETRKYIQSYENQNYKFMHNASFFIYKEDRSKVRKSALLEACENNEEVEEKTFGVEV